MQAEPSVRKTVLSYLDDYARRGDSVAFAHRRGLRTSLRTYGEVAGDAYRLARELEERGVRPGERVLLIGENSPEWVAAFFGCALRGAVVVPLDKESTREFAAAVARQTDPRLVLAGEGVRASEGLGLPTLRLEELSDTVSRHPDTPYNPEGVTEDSLVEIVFTSGTTSQPRGVMLTHGNLLANLLPLEAEIKRYIKWERLVHPIRFLSLVPLSHVFGQFMGLFVPQLLGGEVHFQDSLNPASVARAARKNRVSVMVLVPRMLESLREWVERDYEARGSSEALRERLSAAARMSVARRWWTFRRAHKLFGLKFWAFVSGGATLPAETEEFWQRLGFAVLQGYGMTETASLVSVNHPFKRSRGSVGKLMPGYELKLGEGGEIMVRGASVSPGYWADESSKGGKEDWLSTGDVGELDAEGNLFFKGRKKDVIVTAAGLNVHPEDLEAALDRQPEVRASCVIKWEGPRGAEPLAVVIPRAAGADVEGAVDRTNRELAEYQRVRRWCVWPDADFPRTATQKVLKREVAAEVLGRMGAGHAGAVARDAHSSPAAFVLSHAARAGEAVPAGLGADAKLSDLKLDSLGRVELMSALEDRYQIDIDEASFTEATTLGEVERVVRGEVEGRATPYPYPRWARSPLVRLARSALFYTIVMPVTRLMSRASFEGASGLEGLKGPALFVANHVTLADHALVLVGLPRRLRRRLAIAMEGELLRDWRRPPEGASLGARLLARAKYVLVNLFFHVFPLPRRAGFRRSFAYAGECADRGDSLLVFPEGARAPRGQMAMSRFKAGAGLLAKELNLPVVPVRLEGLYELKSVGKYFAAKGEVRVVFGEPLVFDAGSSPAEITSELERRVAAL